MDLKEGIVSITDHITEYSIEKAQLGKYLNPILSESTQIILVWHKKIDEDFLNQYKNIKAIFRYGVGFDNIDLEFCKKKNILVCNNPDYGVDEVSDSAIAMILNLSRGINELQSFARANKNSWIGEEIPLKLHRLNNLKLGIIGLGRIGGAIARKFKVFSKNICFFDPYLSSGIEKTFDIERADNLDDLLKEVDILSINTPLNHETKGLVNKNFISKMKKDSILINLSRGEIIENTEHIKNALISGKLKGYGTDVWINEPPLETDSLYSHWLENNSLTKKILITPHTAYYSEQALFECRNNTALNCLNYIKGKQIKNRIV